MVDVQDEDAEDVVQGAFLRAFSSFEAFRGEKGKSWPLTIVRNTALTWLKRNRSTRATIGLEQTLEGPRECSPDPEDILLISYDCEHALEQLPPEGREAVILREMGDLSYKEISSTIGVPIGTVMSPLSRGRDRLSCILSHSRPVNPEGVAGPR
jgi:RNA polymerase sigma factor (sigma-70 family)